MKKVLTAIAIIGGLAITSTAVVSASDKSNVDVTGDTFNTVDFTGWLFERDLSNFTGHTFTEDGIVVDVGNSAGEKFIAENFLFQRVSEVGEISFDYMSDEVDSQFYINVYVNRETAPSGNYYDCKYDYVTVTTDDGIKSVNTSGDAQTVTARNSASCPLNLADSPTDSFVRAYAINVGDTTARALKTATIISSTAAGITYEFQAEESDDNGDEKGHEKGHEKDHE